MTRTEFSNYAVGLLDDWILRLPRILELYPSYVERVHTLIANTPLETYTREAACNIVIDAVHEMIQLAGREYDDRYYATEALRILQSDFDESLAVPFLSVKELDDYMRAFELAVDANPPQNKLPYPRYGFIVDEVVMGLLGYKFDERSESEASDRSIVPPDTIKKRILLPYKATVAEILAACRLVPIPSEKRLTPLWAMKRYFTLRYSNYISRRDRAHVYRDKLEEMGPCDVEKPEREASSYTFPRVLNKWRPTLKSFERPEVSEEIFGPPTPPVAEQAPDTEDDTPKPGLIIAIILGAIAVLGIGYWLLKKKR